MNVVSIGLPVWTLFKCLFIQAMDLNRFSQTMHTEISLSLPHSSIDVLLSDSATDTNDVFAAFSMGTISKSHSTGNGCIDGSGTRPIKSFTRLSREFLSMSEKSRPSFVSSLHFFSLILRSSKMSALLKIIRETTETKKKNRFISQMYGDLFSMAYHSPADTWIFMWRVSDHELEKYCMQTIHCGFFTSDLGHLWMCSFSSASNSNIFMHKLQRK